MEQQKCNQCSAPMTLITKRDGTNAYRCEYCGAVIDIIPKTTSDKVFSFINRAINAIRDEENEVEPRSERSALTYQEYSKILRRSGRK